MPSSRPARRADLPTVVIASVTFVAFAASVGQMMLPFAPLRGSEPHLTVEMVTEREVSSRLILKQSMTVLEDGSARETFSAYIQEADEWATVSEVTIGWSGGAEAWSCYVFNTPNPSGTSASESDLPMSHEWNLQAGGEAESRLKSIADEFDPAGGSPRLDTVRHVTFPVDEGQQVSGIECNRTSVVEDRPNARSAARPARVLVDLPTLDDNIVEVRYEDASVRAPQDWRVVSGLVDSTASAPEEIGSIRALGTVAAVGPLQSDWVYLVPAREQFLNVSFATLVVLASALLGMLLQLWSGARARRAQGNPVEHAGVGQNRGRSVWVSVVVFLLVGGAVMRRLWRR